MSSEKLIQDQVMDALQDEASEFKDLSKLNSLPTPPPAGNPLLDDTPPPVPPATAPTPSPADIPSQPVETSKQMNLRLMRERAEAAERKQMEIERRYAEMEKQLKQQQYASPQVQPQETVKELDFNVPDDELIEGKHVKQIVNALKNEINQVKNQFSQINAQTAAQTAEARFQAQYPDAPKVLSSDNIKNFATIYPEEYKSMMSNPDPYAQLKTAYNMITKFGLLENQEEDTRIAQNQAKPRSAASAGGSQTAQTPLSRIGDYDRRVLSEADKERIRQQVAQAKQYR